MDAYSAIQIAVAAVEGFQLRSEHLPLSSCCHGMSKSRGHSAHGCCTSASANIRLGPTLPAFVTPNVLKVLNEKFNLMPIKRRRRT